MLEEVVVIVWVEERLDTIWTMDCRNPQKIVNNSLLHL